MHSTRKTTGKAVAAAGLICGGLVLSGCTQHQAPIRGVSRGDAEAMNAQRSQFEYTQDPPFNAQTHHAAGQLAESQGAYALAAQQYRAALAVDPHHQASLFHLAVVLTQMKAYPEAVAVWNNYIKETREDPAAYANLGHCYELQSKQEEAAQAYQRGIAKDAYSTPCRVNYGLMLARQGRMDDAVTHLQFVLTPAQVHYNIGSVHEQGGELEKAKVEYAEALKIDPRLTAAKMRLDALRPHPASK